MRGEDVCDAILRHDAGACKGSTKSLQSTDECAEPVLVDAGEALFARFVACLSSCVRDARGKCAAASSARDTRRRWGAVVVRNFVPALAQAAGKSTPAKARSAQESVARTQGERVININVRAHTCEGACICERGKITHSGRWRTRLEPQINIA